MSSYAKSAEEIVYINTVSKNPDFLPYTKSSIKAEKLSKRSQPYETIDKIVKSEVEISEKFKAKTLELLRKKILDPRTKESESERIAKLILDIDSMKVNNEFYEAFQAREPIKRIIENENLKLEAKTVVEELVTEEDQAIEDVKAELQIKAALDEEETEVEENFYGLKDDLLEAMKHDGYTEKEMQDVYDSLKGLDKNGVIAKWGEILRNLKPLKKSSEPLAVPLETPEIIPLPQVAEPDTITELIADPGAEIPPPPPSSPDPQEIVPATGPMTEKNERVFESGTGPRPYIKRYHEKSILLYFNNSSYPDWDTTTESNVMNMEASKEEIITMMEDIIIEYGRKIFVEKRKSDTKEELNELIQLQFCVMRNLALGPRAKTANVKLSDLVKIDQMARQNSNVPNSPTGAVGANAPAGAAGAPLPPAGTVIVNPTQTVGPAEPATQTRSEDAFIRNFDNYMLRRNLNLQATPPRVQPAQTYTGSDPRNTAIIPGNNLISLERNSVRRI